MSAAAAVLQRWPPLALQESHKGVRVKGQLILKLLSARLSDGPVGTDQSACGGNTLRYRSGGADQQNPQEGRVGSRTPGSGLKTRSECFQAAGTFSKSLKPLSGRN